MIAIIATGKSIVLVNETLENRKIIRDAINEIETDGPHYPGIDALERLIVTSSVLPDNKLVSVTSVVSVTLEW